MKREEKKLYDENGEWVGIQITETMTREEAMRQYPHLFILPELTCEPEREDGKP